MYYGMFQTKDGYKYCIGAEDGNSYQWYITLKGFYFLFFLPAYNNIQKSTFACENASITFDIYSTSR